MARRVQEVEFVPAQPQPVLDWMGRLARARDGWINLMPGVVDAGADAGAAEGGDPPRPSFFSSLFGSAQPPVTMCTWMPPRGGRHPGDEVTVGIMHPRGRYAVRQLAERGVGLPPGWRVRQDHARRGLVVMAPDVAPDAAVLEWTLRAGAALAAVDLTGSWKARVYLPAQDPSGRVDGVDST
ncbi:MAG TPA: hypothetical protein VHB02_15275 [Acidimicrobiales bacterium]|nr:hypothetical protein [Acidimicrobiales bacterium]